MGCGEIPEPRIPHLQAPVVATCASPDASCNRASSRVNLNPLPWPGGASVAQRSPRRAAHQGSGRQSRRLPAGPAPTLAARFAVFAITRSKPLRGGEQPYWGTENQRLVRATCHAGTRAAEPLQGGRCPSDRNVPTGCIAPPTQVTFACFVPWCGAEPWPGLTPMLTRASAPHRSSQNERYRHAKVTTECNHLAGEP